MDNLCGVLKTHLLHLLLGLCRGGIEVPHSRLLGCAGRGLNVRLGSCLGKILLASWIHSPLCADGEVSEAKSCAWPFRMAGLFVRLLQTCISVFLYVLVVD